MPVSPNSLKNLRTGGREKGVLNRATRLKRELMAPGSTLVQTPIQILASNAEFFMAKADALLNEGKLQEATKYKVLANDTAAILAPYLHARLGVVSVEPDQEAQTYVIRVPEALPDGKAWAHAISDAKTITVDPQMNGSRRNGS